MTLVSSRGATNRVNYKSMKCDAYVYLVTLPDVLQKQLSEHGNDTQVRFPVTMLRKAVSQDHEGQTEDTFSQQGTNLWSK